MSEHRVRPARHHGVLNFQPELIQALHAFGDVQNPLPETVRVLDEIVTDYIIDTVHTASKAATISGRGKVKADDFKFAIRNDEVATGRVKELLAMEKSLKDARQQFDTEEGKVGLERGSGPGRGRKRKNQAPATPADSTLMATLSKDRNGSGSPLPAGIAVKDEAKCGDTNDLFNDLAADN